ncbi:MAG: hypothetical protein KGS61_08500 [Verrucomicrobia bacterium]|nr:hypothetical protein [Verrucomicrobiota bacterium]
MEKLTGENAMAIAPLMQEMAIFFSIFGMPSNADNRYLGILKPNAHRHDIIWSTLNYDCLLEIAACHAALRLNYFGEPSASNAEACVWKLHGSCNFKIANLAAGRGVLFGQGVIFEGGITPIQPHEVRAVFRGNTGLYPAMALYAKGKSISMSPGAIRDAQARWNQRVMSAEKVLLIGVAPNPEDSHIWDSLTKTSATVGFVGSRDMFESWTRPSSAGGKIFLGRYWSGAEKQANEFLIG